MDITILACLLLYFTCVGSLMLLQVGFLDKVLAAIAALVWSLSIVDSLMNSECRYLLWAKDKNQSGTNRVCVTAGHKAATDPLWYSHILRSTVTHWVYIIRFYFLFLHFLNSEKA